MDVNNKKLIMLIFISLYTVSSISQTVSFPDANFKDAIVNEAVARLFGNPVLQDVDVNDDGEIQLTEALNVQDLYLNNDNTTPNTDKIISLDGIESFENIEILQVDWNLLTELDVSQLTSLESLHINYNQLTSIEVSKNILLKTLRLQSNLLTELDIGLNSNLEDLWVQENSLSNLNVSNNSNLQILSCNTNQLAELDVSLNPQLYFLNCFENQITSLDVSQNPLLDRLSCRNNQLTHLNVENGNNSILTRMWAHNNPNLTCINVDDENANFPFCDMSFPFTGWCKDEEASYSENCILNSKDNSLSTLKLFPMPFEDDLFLTSKRSTQITNIQLYSTGGSLIKSIKLLDLPTKLELGELINGVYFMKFNLAEKVIFKKIVKSR